jgi:hypothetical protein
LNTLTIFENQLLRLDGTLKNIMKHGESLVGGHGRRRRQLKIWRKMMARFGAMTTVISGVGPLRPVLGDFPSACGLLLIQGVRSSGGGAPPTAPVCRRRSQLAEGLCWFLLSSRTFL